MTGMQSAVIEAHEKNLRRYAWLLATELTQVERDFIHRRIAEERLTLERLISGDVPIPPTPEVVHAVNQ